MTGCRPPIVRFSFSHSALAAGLRRAIPAAVLAVGATGLGCTADPRPEEVGNGAGTPGLRSTEENEAPAPEAVAPEAWAELKARIRAEFPGVAQMSVDELSARLDGEAEEPLLLDVREPEEYEVSHLEGARLAPDEETALGILADTPADRPVVLYCSVGYRSSRLAEALGRHGRSGVFNLEGSIFEWANAGLPLVSKDGVARTVHPYDAHWGRLLRRGLWAPLDGREPDPDPR